MAELPKDEPSVRSAFLFYGLHKMKDQNKTKKQLIDELMEIRQRIAELEESEIETNQAAQEPKRIEWPLSNPVQTKQKDYVPPYGNLVKINTCRLILDSVGEEVLREIVSDYLELLDTSAAIYEKNGDYALGIFSSSWCRVLDQASRNLCRTDNNREALDCGKWHCHESCWREASKISIETAQPVDIECSGGIRLFAVPIRTGGEIIGSINFGYGDPPQDLEKLDKIAEKYGVRTEELLKSALQYESRPPFVINFAKNRLRTSARLIGEIIERRQVEEGLKKHRETLEEIVKERTRELRDTEVKYRTIADFTYDWEWWMGPEGNFIYVSPSCKRITRYDPEEFLRDPGLLIKIMHPDDRSSFIRHLSEVEQKVAPGQVEFRVMHPDGSYRWIFHVCQAVFDDQGRFLGRRGSNRDITERKHAEEDLRESENRLRVLSSQLLTVKENERKRVARELHDGIGQMLAAIKFRVENTLQQEGERKTKAKEESIELIIPMIQNSIEEVRRIQMDLRPSVLDDLGILATIGWFCREFQKVYSAIRIEKEIEIQEDEVSVPLKTVIYRVMQEALNNIAKHSQADAVRLFLKRVGDRIEFVIEDNGIGFDLEESKRGFGLGSMKERTELSGGTFTFESVKGRGTVIQTSWRIK